MVNGFEFRYNDDAYNIHLYHDGNRKSPGNNESYHYFYNKYKKEDIEKLIPYLEGEISLQELEGYCKGFPKTLFQEEPNMFVSSKFGRRYKAKA